jgi:hypothetical protein
MEAFVRNLKRVLYSSVIPLLAGMALAAPQYSSTIPGGSDILVRVNETIDSRTADEGRIYDAVIDQDVFDTNGGVAIRKGAKAEVLVRRVEPKKELALDLQSVIIDGRRYFVNTDDYEKTQGRKSVGANGRTAKYLGGGAIFGTILGALGGGGKGAAIGALSGAAGGGVLQVLTRGKAVKVPSESVLTFRLERPLHLFPARE